MTVTISAPKPASEILRTHRNLKPETATVRKSLDSLEPDMAITITGLSQIRVSGIVTGYRRKAANASKVFSVHKTNTDNVVIVVRKA